MGEQAVDIQPFFHKGQVFGDVQILRLAKIAQGQPVRVIAVLQEFVPAGAGQNIDLVDIRILRHTLPLGNKMLVDLFPQVVVAPVFTVDVHLNGQGILIDDVQRLCQGGDHHVTKPGGKGIGIGPAKQQGFVAFIIPVGERIEVKPILPIGLSGIDGNGFLGILTGRMAGGGEGAHLVDFTKAPHAKELNIGRVFPFLFVIGIAAAFPFHQGTGFFIEQILFIRHQGNHRHRLCFPDKIAGSHRPGRHGIFGKSSNAKHARFFEGDALFRKHLAFFRGGIPIQGIAQHHIPIALCLHRHRAFVKTAGGKEFGLRCLLRIHLFFVFLAGGGSAEKAGFFAAMGLSPGHVAILRPKFQSGKQVFPLCIRQKQLIPFGGDFEIGIEGFVFAGGHFLAGEIHQHIFPGFHGCAFGECPFLQILFTVAQPAAGQVHLFVPGVVYFHPVIGFPIGIDTVGGHHFGKNHLCRCGQGKRKGQKKQCSKLLHSNSFQKYRGFSFFFLSGSMNSTSIRSKFTLSTK